MNKLDKIIISCEKQIETLKTSSIRNAPYTYRRWNQIASQDNKIVLAQKIINACEKLLLNNPYWIDNKQAIEYFLTLNDVPTLYVNKYHLGDLIKDCKKENIDMSYWENKMLNFGDKWMLIITEEEQKDIMKLLKYATKRTIAEIKDRFKPYNSISKYCKTQEQFDLIKNSLISEVKVDNMQQRIKKQMLIGIPWYYPTPADLVDKMLDKVDLRNGMRVLEPSAWTGAILERIVDTWLNVVWIEYNHSNFQILKDRFENVDLINGDFMEYKTEDKFDVILANPPFENKQDVKHIMKMFDLLKDWWEMVSIASNWVSFRTDKEYVELRDLIDCNWYMESCETGSFKNSWTNVNTVMIYLRK